MLLFDFYFPLFSLPCTYVYYKKSLPSHTSQSYFWNNNAYFIFKIVLGIII